MENQTRPLSTTGNMSFTTSSNDNLTKQASDQNSTDAYLNATLSSLTTAGPEQSSDSDWAYIFIRCMAPLTVICFLLNASSFIALVRKPRGFSPVILFIFKVQTFLDAGCGLLSTVFLQYGVMWRTGQLWFDTFLCYFWHSYGVYWVFVLASIWNLVFIAVDRYRCVVRPLHYQKDQTRSLYWKYALMLVMVILFNCGSFYGAVKMENGQCVDGAPADANIIKTYMYVFALSNYFTYFLIPAFIQVVMYVLIVWTLRQRNKTSNLPSLASLKSITRDITITGLVVCLVFFLLIGYDETCWVITASGTDIGFSGGSPFHRSGIVAFTLNNMVNPIVYFAVMKTFRYTIMETFCCCCVEKRDAGSTSNSTNMTDTVSENPAESSTGRRTEKYTENTNI